MRIKKLYRDIWGFPKIRGLPFGGPNNKDCSIWGSILGSPYFGKLPFGFEVEALSESWVPSRRPYEVPSRLCETPAFLTQVSSHRRLKPRKLPRRAEGPAAGVSNWIRLNRFRVSVGKTKGQSFIGAGFRV